MVGQVVSHYRILSELGKGGMGIVYLATDTLLKRRVAIKMLNAKHLARDKDAHFRLLREARAVSQINHPNIATVYDYGETSDGRQFIVMEYVAGEPLSKLIQRKALNVKGAVEIIGGVAIALSEAHCRGIIHRDIKPSNIILSHRDEVKVLDFGLAKIIESETLTLDGTSELPNTFAAKTREGAVVGTPLYLSPEQAKGGPIDERTDIFSLGSVFYECLTGQPPFYAHSAIEICARILRDEPPPVSKINPAVTAELDRIISKALAKDTSKRYQSAREFRADLCLLDFETIDDQLESAGRTTAGKKEDGKTASAQEVDTKLQRDPSTNEDRSQFVFFLEGFQKMLSGVGSLGKIVLAAMALLLACTAAFVGYRSFANSRVPELPQSVNFQRLPISGNVKEAIISPDGKYVAAVIDAAGKQTIQLTELATSSDIRIAPLSEKGYRGLSFSPDNNYVYYLEDEIETATLYRVSKLGGNSRKLLQNVNTAVTFSPDGSRISFCRYQIKENISVLMTANEDGTDEQILATHSPPEDYVLDGVGGPAWAPSNDVIACITIEKTQTKTQMHIETVNIKDGSLRHINRQGWYGIEKISWLSNGTGLVFAGSESFSNPAQLFLLSYPSGDVTKLTNDPTIYSTISTTGDSGVLLTVKTESLSSVWLVTIREAGNTVTSAANQSVGVADIGSLFDDALVNARKGIDGYHIWIDNLTDGKSSQLTFVGSLNYQPDVSPDKRYIVFVSDRSGSLNIWRMNVDGTNQIQITNGKYEDTPQITPDGKWVVYHSPQSSKNGYIWKVPIDGGEAISLVTRDAMFPAISPDGKMLACVIWDPNIHSSLELQVLSFETGASLKKIALPSATKKSINKLRWSPDSAGLIFVNDVDGVSNLLVQRLDGTVPKPLTDFRESQIFDFAWSLNKRQLVCVRGNITSQAVLIKGFRLKGKAVPINPSS